MPGSRWMRRSWHRDRWRPRRQRLALSRFRTGAAPRLQSRFAPRPLKRPAPPERTETKLAMLSGGANKPEQSIMARSILLQKDAGGRPHAPFLPLTLSKDELGDVLAAAKRLAKKSG